MLAARGSITTVTDISTNEICIGSVLSATFVDSQNIGGANSAATGVRGRLRKPAVGSCTEVSEYQDRGEKQTYLCTATHKTLVRLDSNREKKPMKDVGMPKSP